MKAKEVFLFIIVPIVGVLLAGFLMISPILLFFLDSALAKEEVTTDIAKYNTVIGKDSKYGTKWGLNEDIFPKKIRSSYEVEDFTFVYYNPWDANYLAYLEINYDEDDYEEELLRLSDFGIKKYKTYYGVTGFSEYELIAMDADSYSGFIYAITDGDGKIIYVELQFCNYFMDIDYNKYIPLGYLPDDFDATMDNDYQKTNKR